MKLKFNKSNLLPPIGKLTEFLRYDPSAGLIIWRKHYSSVLAGEIAGSPKTSTGAIHIGIFNKVYLAHRIAWALYHWRDPHPFMIDHKDGEWFWGLNSDYTIMQHQDKAGFWKCPYHNGRACIEIIKRI
jgi:hypothetical protein